MMGMLAKSSTGKGSCAVAGVVTKTRQAAASVRNMNSPKSNAGRLAAPAYVYAAIIPRKSSAFKLAPPTSAPSTLTTAISSAALDGLTEPP